MDPKTLFSLGKIDSDEKLIRAAFTWVSILCNRFWSTEFTSSSLFLFNILRQIDKHTFLQKVELLKSSENLYSESVDFLMNRADIEFRETIIDSSENVSMELKEWAIDLLNFFDVNEYRLNSQIMAKYKNKLPWHPSREMNTLFLNQIYHGFIDSTFVPLFEKSLLSREFSYIGINNSFLFGIEKNILIDGAKIKVISNTCGFSEYIGLAWDSRISGINDTLIMPVDEIKSICEAWSYDWFYNQENFTLIEKFKDIINNYNLDIITFQRKFYQTERSFVYNHEVGHNKTIPRIIKILNQFRSKKRSKNNSLEITWLKRILFEIAADLYAMGLMINNKYKYLLLLRKEGSLARIINEPTSSKKELINEILGIQMHQHFFDIRTLISKDPLKKYEELNSSFEKVLQSKDLESIEQWIIEQKEELEKEVKKVFIK
jgi:hypothetical protein